MRNASALELPEPQSRQSPRTRRSRQQRPAATQEAAVLTNIHQSQRQTRRLLQQAEELANEEAQSTSTSVGAGSRSESGPPVAVVVPSASLTTHALDLLNALERAETAQRRASEAASSDLSDLSSEPVAQDEQTSVTQHGTEQLPILADDLEETASLHSLTSSTGSNTLRRLTECDHTVDSVERDAALQQALSLLQRWKSAWHDLDRQLHQSQAKRDQAARAAQRMAVQRQRAAEHLANERTMTTRQTRDP